MHTTGFQKMSSLDRPSVSVVIPVHNGGDKFRKCLRSLAASGTAPEEVIVASDGDSDGSWQVAEEFGARVLRNPTRKGPAHARNLGAHTATGDILFFFDADVTIPENAVSLIIETFQHNPDVSAIIGSYDAEPSEGEVLAEFQDLVQADTLQRAKEEASTFWCGCGAIRREVFLAMGGFDERYQGPTIEDIELGYRLKIAGYRIRLLKELQVKHLKRWGIVSLLRADFLYRAIPWTNLILNEGRFIDDLNVNLSGRLSVIFTFALLSSLCGTFWIPRLMVPAIMCAAGLVLINRDLYRFFRKNRGWSFALKSIPWHWAYFFYSGIAFAIGLARHWSRVVFTSDGRRRQRENDSR